MEDLRLIREQAAAYREIAPFLDKLNKMSSRRGWRLGKHVLQNATEDLERLQLQIDDLRTSVIAFCAPWAAQWAQDHELPANHLHATHYDILAKCGARMDDFKRWEG